MNTAVLLLTACLPGQVPSGPAPAPVRVYPAPGTAQVYPAPVQGYPVQGYPVQSAPVVVATPNRGYAGDCCGHSSVSGDCGGHAKQCCLSKLWSKLSCFKLDLCGKCDKGCDTGHKSLNLCDKGGHKSLNLCNKAPACPQPCPPAPVCNPCPPKPVCQPCPKPVCNPCPKVECPKPDCHNPCAKPCFSFGKFLHKCKNLFGCCDKGDPCQGAVAAPNACGSTVIPPAPGTVVPVQPVPGTVAPAAPAPELRKMPQKVGSSYNPVNQTSTPASAPRTIDLGAPF